MTHLVFGSCCDGPVWPETADGSEAAIGSAVVGPAGLVSALEHELGTRRPAVAPVSRIAAMRAKLAAADHGNRCWSRSFGADPWSTARLILSWRDELVAGGWQGAAHPASSPRIADILAAEAAGPPLAPGFADRCAVAAESLEARPRALPWRRVVLIEPRRLLAPGIRRLLAAIERCGAAIGQNPRPAPAGGDLGRAQRLVSGEPGQRAEGDGSLIVLRAETEAMAADALADWFAAGSEAARAGACFVLGAPTASLDAAFARRGLPRFAHSAASPARAALQVLHLAFATRWAPFDPFALMELLLLPDGPVPRRVARRLARALAETPGRGSPVWSGALEEGVALRRSRFEADGLAGAELARRLRADTDQWQAWVQGAAHDPARGMPAGEALRTCTMVSAWAAKAPDDALRMTAAACAGDLAAAISGFGSDLLPRALLSRMIDEAIGPGVADPASVAEAAPWSAVHSPGALWGRAETVVWWAPGGPAMPRSGPWTRAETEALAACGCAVDSATASLAALAHAWRQPVLNAGRQLVLAVAAGPAGPEKAAGEHPLFHELRSLLEGAPEGVVFRAETLLTGAPGPGGRASARAPVAPAVPEPPGRWWAVEPGAVGKPSTASATSLGKLLGCRFAWVAEYAAGVRPGSRAAVPEGQQLLGLLAHAVARDVLLPGAPPEPGVGRERARVALEGLLASEAAPLLLPGHAAELARARLLIPDAIERLARRIGAAGLRLVGTEIELSGADGALPGVALGGRLDLLLEDANGARVVVDMKWTRDDKYRRAELREGRALQLAVYSRLQQPAAPRVTAAYFMLAQSRLLAADPWPFEGAQIAGTDLANTWREVSSGWRTAIEALERGEIDATGVGEEESEPLCGVSVAPPCNFCLLGRLCGLTEIT